MTEPMTDQKFDFSSLRVAYAAGTSVQSVVEAVFDRIVAADDPGIFLALRDREEVLAGGDRPGPV